MRRSDRPFEESNSSPAYGVFFDHLFYTPGARKKSPHSEDGTFCKRDFWLRSERAVGIKATAHDLGDARIVVSTAGSFSTTFSKPLERYKIETSCQGMRLVRCFLDGDVDMRSKR